MNVSKGLFVVLLMSVIGMLLSSVALAAPPTLAVTGVPDNVIAGSSFKVTVVSSNTTAGQTITAASLVNSLNWAVSPGNSQNCGNAISCVADFTVSVPLSAAVGQGSVITAQATANTGEVTPAFIKTVVVSGAPSAGNKPAVKVDAVEVDGFELSTSETNIRDMERGKEFTMKVKLTGNAQSKNVEIRAFVSGFDFSDKEPISDSTSPFDVQAGVSYVKSLSLKLPERADEDNYRVRVVVAGRDTDDITMNYRIKVSASAHDVAIKDFVVTPEEVQPGRAVLATVRVKNVGQKTEDEVTIKVSIPELGVTAAPDFVDSLESDKSATSEEFFLRIDPCAKPGTYDVKAEVTFKEGDESVSSRQPITVTQGGTCQSRPSVVSGGDVTVYGSEPQNIEVGETGSYSVTVSNRGASTKIFSLSAAGADWASVKFSPGSMVTVKAGDTQAVVAMVTPNNNAAEGANAFTIRVKDQSGDVVKDLQLSANVAGNGGADVSDLVQLLQWGLIALIVVLVVVGLVVAFRRMKGPRENEDGTQTYY